MFLLLNPKGYPKNLSDILTLINKNKYAVFVLYLVYLGKLIILLMYFTVTNVVLNLK